MAWHLRLLRPMPLVAATESEAAVPMAATPPVARACRPSKTVATGVFADQCVRLCALRTRRQCFVFPILRREGLATCEHALLVQMEVEEGVLYPTLRLRMTESEAECTLDAYAQNYAVADLLRRLMLLAPDDEIWRASLRVVKENLERHHAEEE